MEFYSSTGMRRAIVYDQFLTVSMVPFSEMKRLQAEFLICCVIFDPLQNDKKIFERKFHPRGDMKQILSLPQ